MLSCFHLIPECNGRTDRRTDRFAISVSHVSMLRSLLADTLMTSMMIIQMLISLDVFMVMYYSWSCMMHELFVAADCSQNIIRVLFVDFSKAFDVIDHNVLLNKFISNNITEHIIVWSLDFLNGCKQFVIRTWLSQTDHTSAAHTICQGHLS